MLQLLDVHKWFGRQHVVSGLSFVLNQGMVLGLLGPNGAGKTTTIRMLTGLVSPTAGSVVATIYGQDMSPMCLDFRRYVGYCPEQPPLYPEMTVYRYLYTVCRLRGVPKNRCAEAIDRVLIDLDLVAESSREISVLSKGQRQRVNIAQSLVHDPLIWVLDEPLGGLDPAQVTMVRDLIVAKGKSKAILVSSHLLSEMTQMCTDILIVKQGQLLVSDSLANLAAGARPISLTLGIAPDSFRGPFESECDAMSWDFATRDGDLYCYRIVADRDIREQLFYLCCRQNWPIYGLDMSRKPLEELYLEVIR